MKNSIFVSLLLLVSILSFSSVCFAAGEGECDGKLSLTRNGGGVMPPKSDMLEALYGKDYADKVYNRLQELDPLLNEIIQRVAYDVFWAREGLSTRDKSLVTVVSLIALGKEEQIRIHINGFLGAGGSLQALQGMLIHLGAVVGRESAMNGLMGLKETLSARGVEDTKIIQIINHVGANLNNLSTIKVWDNDDLDLKDKNIVNVAAAVAIGKQAETRDAIWKYLVDGGDLDTLRNIFIHQIVYCGFPTAMNAFAALLEVKNKK